MKKTTLLFSIAALAIASCSKSTTPAPSPTVEAFNSYWPWTNITLKGVDSLNGFPDLITSNGTGRFVYDNDTFSITVVGTQTSIPVVQTAATGYNLSGTVYDTVEISKLDGSGLDWHATYGRYSWMFGREFYQLKFITSTTYFSPTYTDSL